MNGAEAMVKCLEAEGVTRIFGYPGVAISPFYEAVYNSGSIGHILVRQEQAAGHAANGYARIARKAAVCVTSSGPGATNLITALATAYPVNCNYRSGRQQSFRPGRISGSRYERCNGILCKIQLSGNKCR